MRIRTKDFRLQFGIIKRKSSYKAFKSMDVKANYPFPTTKEHLNLVSEYYSNTHHDE